MLDSADSGPRVKQSLVVAGAVEEDAGTAASFLQLSLTFERSHGLQTRQRLLSLSVTKLQEEAFRGTRKELSASVTWTEQHREL